MKERRKSVERRKKARRKLLNEKQFRTLIEKGKVSDKDERKWEERRNTKRRRKQIGV
ncbi:hypothetical protein IBX73_01695 [candidate division WOR-3 bacterium]|nr:hypothetical protein [candidate division WOR-3 bacterium]